MFNISREESSSPEVHCHVNSVCYVVVVEAANLIIRHQTSVITISSESDYEHCLFLIHLIYLSSQQARYLTSLTALKEWLVSANWRLLKARCQALILISCWILQVFKKISTTSNLWNKYFIWKAKRMESVDKTTRFLVQWFKFAYKVIWLFDCRFLVLPKTSASRSAGCFDIVIYLFFLT